MLIVGLFFSFLGSFGLVRLPDIYTRLHAATKSSTLGIIGLLLATGFYFWDVDKLFVGKLLLGIIFLFMTSPVGGHMIARAAYHRGVPLASISIHDDLKENHTEKE